MNHVTRKTLSWPAAATLIASVVALMTVVVGVTDSGCIDPRNGNVARYATAREIGEVKARLEALEQSSREMRSELRTDIKDLRDLIQQTLRPKCIAPRGP